MSLSIAPKFWIVQAFGSKIQKRPTNKPSKYFADHSNWDAPFPIPKFSLKLSQRKLKPAPSYLKKRFTYWADYFICVSELVVGPKKGRNALYLFVRTMIEELYLRYSPWIRRKSGVAAPAFGTLLHDAHENRPNFPPSFATHYTLVLETFAC